MHSLLELVQQLSNANMWWRLTAQRLLVERQDKSVLDALRTLAHAGSAADGRMHALWTLEGLHALESGLLLAALDDQSPAVREQAVRLAENYLTDSKIADRLSRMTADPDGFVAFQVACTLASCRRRSRLSLCARLQWTMYKTPGSRSRSYGCGGGCGPLVSRNLVGEQNFIQVPGDGKAQFLRRITGIIGRARKYRELQETLSRSAGTREARPVVASGRSSGARGRDQTRLCGKDEVVVRRAA